MASAYARLTAYGCVPISHGGPQLLPPATGSVTAFKFRDPDGHPIELIHFPDRLSGPGIDHTAIAVADGERSIAFYRDRLGLSLSARQINTGPAQERLDDLAGVVVEVVALEPAQKTPHIELLAYKNPAPHASEDWAENDIAADRTVLEVDSLAAAMTRLEIKGPLFHDPDGHFIRLAEATNR